MRGLGGNPGAASFLIQDNTLGFQTFILRRYPMRANNLLLALLLSLPTAALPADAPAAAAASDPNQACFDCHVASKPG